MIYLDNAATTYPKPKQVINTVATAISKYGGNPGRSGHSMSIQSAMQVYETRQAISNMFNIDGPENVVFTQNCTHAINTVLKGYLKANDHVVISCLEHNAVLRPLHSLKEKIDITITKANVYPMDNDRTLDSFRQAINSKTRLIVCIHGSNVWGIKLPIERICALAHQYGIKVLVDAAQTGGLCNIDIQDSGIDFLCIAGHKGFYAPMGIGALITKYGENLQPLIEGGTGTNSISPKQPELMPERLEFGTQNMLGICGFKAGIDFTQKKGINNIFKHEMTLIDIIYEQLLKIKGIKIYTPKPDPMYFVPVLSFNLSNFSSEEVALKLDKNNIKVRAGLHCAPLAHEFAGTLSTGAVRICPSVFTSQKDIEYFIFILKKIAGNLI